MTDYEVGYGRPPIHTRFKKGVCPNPKGRGKRDSTEMANIIRNALSVEVEYREGQRVRRGSKLEASIRKLFSEAMRGDVGSAALLLKMRDTSRRTETLARLLSRLIFLRVSRPICKGRSLQAMNPSPSSKPKRG